MEKFSHLDEIYISSADKYKFIQNLLEKNLIKKIAPQIYTSIFNFSEDEIIKRNLLKIISEKFPGSIISHRSAFEIIPFQNNLFVTYIYTKKIDLPGVTINLLEGFGPMEGDINLNGASISQRERAFLENLQISKSKIPKCLEQKVLEEKLEMILRTRGEEELNVIRDKARIISIQLNLNREFEKLQSIIGAMLNTRSIKNLKSDLTRARVKQIPYDQNRILLFDKLFMDLKDISFTKLPDKNTTHSSYSLFAFFESYFSNYIEGTKFSIDDAKKIIDSCIPMEARKNDSHDILGTYILVSRKEYLSQTAKNPEEFLELLKLRHSILLKERIEFTPGEFKQVSNSAGNTVFVEPNLVKGTLLKGFEFYAALRDPFAKAAFVMFLISEVHPFNDGNGRIARVFMNSELTADNQSKIIISTQFREDYILNLKKLTKQHISQGYINMLTKAHHFSSLIIGEDFLKSMIYLNENKAFEETTTLTFPFKIEDTKQKSNPELNELKDNINIPSVDDILGKSKGKGYNF